MDLRWLDVYNNLQYLSSVKFWTEGVISEKDSSEQENGFELD